MQFSGIQNKGKTIAIIPARGGSKGIPGKNIKMICGKPLIAWTIEAAINSSCIDYVMVSTDDDVIANVAKEYGADVPFLRPSSLASDESKTIDCVVDAISKLEKEKKYFDTLILLQPTSPLRTGGDIKAALGIFEANDGKGVVSVNEARSNPALIRRIGNDGDLERLLNEDSTVRRQDMKKYYEVNGAVYINKIKDVNDELSFNDNTVPYVMPIDRSVDIDTIMDFYIAEAILKQSLCDNDSADD